MRQSLNAQNGAGWYSIRLSIGTVSSKAISASLKSKETVSCKINSAPQQQVSCRLASVLSTAQYDHPSRNLRPLTIKALHYFKMSGRARSEPGGTWWRTGVEVKGKLANGVGTQYSHATSERGLSSITEADAHTSAASSRLNWRPHRFKWTRPFRGKTKSGFCVCAITFRTSYTNFIQAYKTIAHLQLLRSMSLEQVIQSF